MQEDEQCRPYIHCRSIERQKYAATERACWQWGAESEWDGIKGRARVARDNSRANHGKANPNLSVAIVVGATSSEGFLVY